MTLVVDAGPLYAVADARDRHHRACVALFAQEDGPLIVPALVVTEVAYLVGTRLGAQAEVAFGRSIASGELQVEPPAAQEWARIEELAAEYSDLPLGLVDASVVVLAERLGARRVASLDQRHLGVVRPSHVDALELVP